MRRRTIISYETTTGLSRRDVVRVCGDTSTCGTPDETRTEYDYWGNTFLPSVVRRIDAARGETLETLYTYDDAGKLLVEDGPLPGTGDAKYFRYDVWPAHWEIGPRMPMACGPRYFSFRDSDDRWPTWTKARSRVRPTPRSRRFAVSTTAMTPGAIRRSRPCPPAGPPTPSFNARSTCKTGSTVRRAG